MWHIFNKKLYNIVSGPVMVVFATVAFDYQGCKEFKVLLANSGVHGVSFFVFLLGSTIAKVCDHSQGLVLIWRAREAFSIKRFEYVLKTVNRDY